MGITSKQKKQCVVVISEHFLSAKAKKSKQDASITSTKCNHAFVTKTLCDEASQSFLTFVTFV